MVLEPGDPHHDGRLRRGTSLGPSAPCFMQRVRREGCGLPGSAGQRSGAGGRGCAVRSFPREAGVAGDAEGLRTETGGPGVCGLLRHLALTAVVVPSRAESFSHIPLDAFADRASPVVATAGRPAELVTEPHTGFTSSPADLCRWPPRLCSLDTCSASGSAIVASEALLIFARLSCACRESRPPL